MILIPLEHAERFERFLFRLFESVRPKDMKALRLKRNIDLIGSWFMLIAIFYLGAWMFKIPFIALLVYLIVAVVCYFTLSLYTFLELRHWEFIWDDDGHVVAKVRRRLDYE